MTHQISIVVSIAAAAILAGCSTSRQPVQREIFFRPLAQRAAYSTASASKLEFDSLRSIVADLTYRLNQVGLDRSLSGSNSAVNDDVVNKLESANRVLSGRISELEGRIQSWTEQRQRMSIADSLMQQNTSLRQVIYDLQNKVSRLEIEKQQLAQRAPVQKAEPPQAPAPIRQPEVSTASHNLSLTDEYQNALDQFNSREYEQAAEQFDSLLKNGVDDQLADNCEYWIGESKFALGKYRQASEAFLRVIAMPQSNKSADAYLMLGRCYEQADDLLKARSAYQTLIKQYPNTSSAAIAKGKLRQQKYRLNQSGEGTSTMS